MNRSIVITGTSTDIGKTVFAAGLAGLLDGAYWKPVQSGLEGGTDTETIARLSGLPADRILPEAYRLALPASPHAAAAAEGVTIDPERLMPPATDRPLIIEGAGGLLVPLTRQLLFGDMFARWGAPVVVVAGTQLGTINHSLLTLEALRARAIPIIGVAFVGDANEDGEATICAMGNVRPLGRLPWLRPLTCETLTQAFRAAFRAEDFA